MGKIIHSKRFQAACVTGFLLFLLLIAAKERMLVTKDYQGRVFGDYRADLLVEYMLFAASICFLMLWKGKMKNPRLEKITGLITLAVMPMVSFFMFETLAGNFKTIIVGNMQLVRMNFYIWYIFYALVFMLTNRVRMTILIMNGFTYIFGLANGFVLRFREQPIMPMDLPSITTAASVASEFEYDFSAEMIVMGILFMLIILWTRKVDFRWKSFKVRVAYAFLTIGCTWFVFSGMLVGDWFAKAGSYAMDFFRFSSTYAKEGYMVCTMKSIRFLNIEEPEGYSVQKVEQMAEEVKENPPKETQLPENVIVIMNEAFADLSVVGEFQTSEPVLAYYNSLEGENIKKGNLYVSVFGGGTANTEFEVLSGNSIAYIPDGVVAYQMYVEEGDSSIVSQFKKNGYKTIAFHPYRKENYKRPQVYEAYGFDEYYGVDDVEIKKVRKFATDKSDYKNLIRMYEEKALGEKLFIFNVTMQNHSGYDVKKFKSTVTLPEYPGQYPQTEQYLSLLKKSDKALQYLLEYFSQVDEKTVILLFGDHQPRLEDGFVEFLAQQNVSGDAMKDFQRIYITPYLLWSNYDLDIKAKEDISANYLGSYLLEAIGMDLPIYNQYLLNLQEEIPVMNLYGYMDKEGGWHYTNEEGSAYTQLFKDYRLFQYNNLFDDRNRIMDLYE